VLEASDGVGGRVRTDRVPAEGGAFLVDRGFQVYLTAYPEGRRLLRLDELELRTFIPGAMVRCDGRFWRVADPLRFPLRALGTMLSRTPLLTRRDLVALGVMDLRLRIGGEEAAWRAPEQTAEAFLRGAGLSDRVIERFFRPFFGGVFLDRSLRTSARKLRATYRMFGRGRAALPAAGMQAIPEQLAARLGPESVRTAQRVVGVRAGEIETAGEGRLAASAVVVAVDGATAAELLPGREPPAWKSTTSISFAADAAPGPEPILYLDGDGTGPANHVAVVSNVQPGYAPPGRALVSANVVAPFDGSAGDDRLVDDVRRQLHEWFGSAVDDWSHLRTDVIERALPSEDAPALEDPRRPVSSGIPGVFVAGDHLDNASINGALQSGRRAAEAVIAQRA
jgi:phytoene dehydrogenase-like protein